MDSGQPRTRCPLGASILGRHAMQRVGLKAVAKGSTKKDEESLHENFFAASPEAAVHETPSMPKQVVEAWWSIGAWRVSCGRADGCPAGARRRERTSAVIRTEKRGLRYAGARRPCAGLCLEDSRQEVGVMLFRIGNLSA